MNKERSAGLIHGYLPDKKNPNEPDRLTRVGILAACELYRRGEIDKICLTSIKELSAPQVKRINRLLNNPPEENIVVEPKSVSTRKEIKTFKKLAEENSWTHLVSIGNHEHTRRIIRETNSVFGNNKVDVRSSKEVLSQFPRYKSLLEEMVNWSEQKPLAIQEKILDVPILGNIILFMADPLGKTKVKLQIWFLREIEKLQNMKSKVEQLYVMTL